MKIEINWNKNRYKEYLKYLEKIAESDTKKFNEKIFNTNYKVLGIKTPVLKTIAKEISHTNIKEFLDNCGSTYFEEVMIEGFVISYIRDNNTFLDYFYKFVDKIDSWALCDSCVSNFKIMKKNDFSDVAYSLILDSREFYVRVGYIMLLDHYVDDEHINNIISLCVKDSSYYYVNMAISWLVCDCFIKYRSITLELLKSKKLSPFVQNKAISKIRDSFRVSKEDKELVKSFKL